MCCFSPEWKAAGTAHISHVTFTHLLWRLLPSDHTRAVLAALDQVDMRSSISGYVGSKFSFQDLNVSKEASTESFRDIRQTLAGRNFKEDSGILRYITLPIIILNNMPPFKGDLRFLRLFEVTKSVDTHHDSNDLFLTQPGSVEHLLCAWGTQEKNMTGLARKESTFFQVDHTHLQLTKLDLKQVVYFKRLSYCV